MAGVMQTPQEAAWVTAVAAGLLSFASPCVLPLIPGYLSMISGLSGEQLRERRGRHLARVVFACLLFAVGFTPVYILVGLSVGAIGQWLTPHRVVVNIILGAVVVFFGLFVMGLLNLPFLYRIHQVQTGRRAFGLWGAPLLGFAFAFGWTPCIGPWTAGLLAVAQTRPPAQAALLFGLYGTTFSACFIAAGLFFAFALRAFAFLQRHYRVIEIASGALLVVIGALIATQQWDRATIWIMQRVPRP
jgi:cytochrome c-type biogenesis protein